MDHYESAEHLLQSAQPRNPLTCEPYEHHLALAHAILALIDKLDETPLVALYLDEEDDEEEDDD